MIKDTKKKSILLLLITLVILFFVIKDDFKSVIGIISTSNILLVLLALISAVIYYFFKAYSMYTISQKYKSTVKFNKFFKQTIITQFFNGITPFATGGQPMQIYMLTEEKMPISKASSTVLMDFMAYQVAIIVYCIVTLLLDIKLNIFGDNSLARNLVYLGFVINLVVCFFASIFCFYRKATSLIVKYISKILIKVHREHLKEKMIVKVREFHEGTRLFINDKFLFIKCIMLNIIGLSFFYVIPFILTYSLIGEFKISILISIVCSSYVFLVGAFVPIPGGSGGVEYGFIQFFGKFFIHSHLIALLLLWRFVTYYFAIIVGGILFSFRTKRR